jgi:hypothetical protein
MESDRILNPLAQMKHWLDHNIEKEKKKRFVLVVL